MNPLNNSVLSGRLLKKVSLSPNQSSPMVVFTIVMDRSKHTIDAIAHDQNAELLASENVTSDVLFVFHGSITNFQNRPVFKVGSISIAPVEQQIPSDPPPPEPSKQRGYVVVNNPSLGGTPWSR